MNSTYKSINYSNKKQEKSWGILSFYINKKSNFSKSKAFCNLYLSRAILYIERDKTISQIGKMYLPLFNLKYLLFFFKLVMSRKTLGHYLKKNYGNTEDNVTFEVVDEYTSNTKFSVILNKNKYKVTERIIKVKCSKLTIYVEEFK